MDSLTHLTLGACTGELLLGKKLGKKAMLYGAISANVADLDTIPGFFVSGDKALLLHRGIMHSIFFAVVAGIFIAYLAKKIHPRIPLNRFIFFFCFQLLLHDLLDTCTGYGTGLLEPFSHHRFSFHLLYVADPLFTIGLLVCTIYLLFGRKHRERWAAVGLAMSAVYLCVACFCKVYIDTRVNASFTTPAPFTSLLWYCVLKTGHGYYTGYQSVFDKKTISYTYRPQNDSLLKTPEPYLKTFADGYYTISQSNNRLYFNVIRFGEVQGWQTKDAPFVLSYPIATSNDENMVIQNGRLRGWTKTSFKQYLERIGGR